MVAMMEGVPAAEVAMFAVGTLAIEAEVVTVATVEVVPAKAALRRLLRESRAE